jgi:AcrR family transcriptional regulator
MPRDDETGGHGREDVRRSLQLMWGGPGEPTRGPKPALTVGGIVRAAIEMTDADGLAALSMRRIAAALGVGAMSLYRYVPNKGVLVDLMVDEAYREDIAAAQAVTGGWRERLEALSRQEWALYLRHPWMLQVPRGRPMLGRHSMLSTEITLRAVDGIGLDEDEVLAAVVTVGSFVSGLARTSSRRRRRRGAPASPTTSGGRSRASSSGPRCWRASCRCSRGSATPGRSTRRSTPSSSGCSGCSTAWRS